jgi:NTE family protein
MQICLALGGGGFKGIAHLGVIDCLERSGIQIKAIAGTSIGGVVGALYACGQTPAQILTLVENIDPATMYRRQHQDGPSLLGYTGLAEALEHILGKTEFCDLRIPFACTAVDIHTASEVYLNQGKVIDAVLATMAIPGIFPPKMRGNAELIDGGVLDPVPVGLARRLAPGLAVVAVPLNPERSQWSRLPEFSFLPPMPLPSPIIEGFARLRVGKALQIFSHSIDITSRMLTELHLEVDQPEVIIRPNVHQYGILDPVNPKVAYEAGLKATEIAYSQIQKAAGWQKQFTRQISHVWQRSSHGEITFLADDNLLKEQPVSGEKV